MGPNHIHFRIRGRISMKVFIVCLSLTAVASASLEPAGYRPPGSASSQYLPPHYDHDHSHHHPSQGSDTPALPPASQYLPPSYNRPPTPTASFSSQYLPPRPQPQQRPPAPSTNYLPAADKPVPAPSNEYLPPLPPTPAVKPANDYLPPATRTSTLPVSSYLPPTTAAPAPSSEYLPPRAPTPNSEYLPPSRPRPAAPTTSRPRISVITVSPYKLDGPAYTGKQQQQQQKQQPQLPRAQYSSGLATSATAAPVRAPAHPKQPQYPTEVKGFEQPADNYLPPLAGSNVANDGYQYGGAATRGSAASLEQNSEPAKYDFEYRVSDEFGNDFGHQESRSGEQTHGVYSVLLPDGRKQIVRYEADEHGFKPRITYEEAASVLGPKAAGLASDGYDGNGLGPY